MKASIEKAILELRNDGVVAIPTETVYGLAANAFSESAVRKIFDLKNRPYHNPLIVHLQSVNDLEKIAKEVPDTAFRLGQYFWPGPLTLVLKKKDIVPNLVSSGLDTVAVRVPNHPLTLELLQNLSFPLAAPSANPFGSISPTSARHVESYFKDQVNCILDGGDCERGVESTILSFQPDGHPVVLRHGSVSIEELEDVTGNLKFFTHDDNKPKAPGMMSRHYAPSTTSYLTSDISGTMAMFAGKRIGLLLFNRELRQCQVLHQEVLSKTGDFKEAAKNLYAAMHRLDNLKPDVLILEKLPETSLGITINDKLRRAAKQEV